MIEALWIREILFFAAFALSTSKALSDIGPYWYQRKPYEWVGEVSSMLVGCAVASVAYMALSLV